MSSNSKNEVFDFLTSSLWLDFTQKRYLTPKEIQHRLQQQETLPPKWKELETKLILNRKIGAIPLTIHCIDKKFWFFPSDCLNSKIDAIEKLGHELYNLINKQIIFRAEFFLDSIVEEAITSAIYEGAQSTRAQAQQLIASGNKPKNKNEWMLVNNFKAMNWVKNHQDEPISQKLILELHRIVTFNTMEGDDINFSGQFRNNKVFVGSHEGIQHEHIEEAINEIIALTTKNPRTIHPLIRGILFHYFIAYIHPFFDGNGRTARALFYFKSMQNKLEYIQLLSVSAYLKEHGMQYEKAFDKVIQNEFDVTYFIEFCLDSIHASLAAVSRKISYLLKINGLSETVGLSANQVGLLQRMALNKFRKMSIEEYAKQISMSREVARQELKSLTELELLQETKEGKKFVFRINKTKLEDLLKFKKP